MSETSTERLKNYLAQLPPQAQALLMREFERAIDRGEDATVANFVLGQLRQIVRSSEDDIRPRTDDPARLLFRPLEPFLAETSAAVRPGQIRRGSLPPVWQWLQRDGAPDQVREFEATLKALRGHSTPSEIDSTTRKLQFAAADAISQVTAAAPDLESRRTLSRIGPPDVIEDLRPIGAVLKHRDALDSFNGKLPGTLRVFADPQINSITAQLNVPTLQAPQLLPFALSLVMQRLAAPWQIIRLAIKIAGSDDETKVAATNYGVVVTMAIHDLGDVAAKLRADIKRGHFANVCDYLKTVHDGMRGLRTELDIRNDSPWGRQMASIRVDISNSLQSEIESVPGRVRRLLRQRADKDISAATKLDDIEVDEVASLIDFVAICRTYASELAINEVTLRTYSDLQQYIEQSTEALVQALRGADARTRGFRQMQMKAAIRFCEVMFGKDYAALMARAAESAVTGERKPSRAG
jgi:hypothetical protein